jgi:hypothetical protein
MPSRRPDEPQRSVEGMARRHRLELHALVIACGRSGFPKLAISKETREKLAGMDDPLARFLKSLLEGGVPPIPSDLPADLRSVLEELLSSFGGRPEPGEEG